VLDVTLAYYIEGNIRSRLSRKRNVSAAEVFREEPERSPPGEEQKLVTFTADQTDSDRIAALIAATSGDYEQ
jgi:hypothetical protein